MTIRYLPCLNLSLPLKRPLNLIEHDSKEQITYSVTLENLALGNGEADGENGGLPDLVTHPKGVLQTNPLKHRFIEKSKIEWDFSKEKPRKKNYRLVIKNLWRKPTSYHTRTAKRATLKPQKPMPYSNG